MKRIIALLLVCLQLTAMAAIAHSEEKPLQFYQEILLPLPEGYVWLGMDLEPGGSLLVLGRHTDGNCALFRWQDIEATPEIIPLPDYGESLTTMEVAADGGVMLSSLPRKRGTNEETLAGSIIWVSASGAEIARFGIESEAENPVLEALPGRRVAFAAVLPPALPQASLSLPAPLDLLMYDDQGTVLFSVPNMAVDSLLFNEEVLYAFCGRIAFALSADTGEKMNSYRMENGHFRHSSIGLNGEILIVEKSGIYACNLTEGTVEKRVDAFGTSFGGMNSFVEDGIVLPEGAFAVAIGDQTQRNSETLADDSVFTAIYRPAGAIANRTPFVITRMNDSSEIINEATSVFQRRHPELDVQLRTFDTFWDGGLTKEDASRVVITELLAVGGGDVIVLDFFPVDAMMKRGMLRDIAHLVPELSLLPGIADSLQYADGLVYAIPAQFSIPTLLGREGVVSGIETFADILEAPIEPYEARIDCSDYTIETMIKVCMRDFLDDQGRVDFLSPDFIAFLDILRQLHAEAEYAPTTGEVAMVGYMKDNMNLLEWVYGQFGKEEGRTLKMPSLHGFRKQYKPELQLGVPVSAKHPALSEEFICLALSEEMGLATNEVFSTVPNLLDRRFDERMKKNKVGEPYGVDLAWLEKREFAFAIPSEAYLMELHALLREVTEPMPYVDDQVIAFILEELPALFEGKATAEETAQSIEQRAFLFMNE